MSKGNFIFILFDLPVITKTEKRTASKFRRELLKNGYFMLQASVYYKYTKNNSFNNEYNFIKRISPNDGSVIFINFPFSLLNNIKYIIGNPIAISNLVNDVFII